MERGKIVYFFEMDHFVNGQTLDIILTIGTKRSKLHRQINLISSHDQIQKLTIYNFWTSSDCLPGKFIFFLWLFDVCYTIEPLVQDGSIFGINIMMWLEIFYLMRNFFWWVIDLKICFLVWPVCTLFFFFWINFLNELNLI